MLGLTLAKSLQLNMCSLRSLGRAAHLGYVCLSAGQAQLGGGSDGLGTIISFTRAAQPRGLRKSGVTVPVLKP